MFRLYGSIEPVASLVSQMSPAGWGSPTTVPFGVTAGLVVANPWVWPEMRLSAPGVDGPKPVLYALSLIANTCA